MKKIKNKNLFYRRKFIDAYCEKKFRSDNNIYYGSILCLPSGIHSWKIQNKKFLIKEDINLILKESSEIEILIFGLYITKNIISTEIINFLEKDNISVEIMNIGSAVRTFNILLEENRLVAAGIITEI